WAILAMQAATGTKFKVVHNKSTATSKTQVLGGHVDVLGANVSEVVSLVKQGDLRILRSPCLTRETTSETLAPSTSTWPPSTCVLDVAVLLLWTTLNLV